MPADPRTLRQQRHQLIEQNRALNDRVEAETPPRDFNTEERAEYDGRFAEITSLASRIQRAEQIEAQERELGEPANDPATRTEGSRNGSGPESTDDPVLRNNPRATAEYRSAFHSYMRSGLQSLPDTEVRALQAGSDIEGGYVVAPPQFVRELIQAVDDAVFIRQLATVVPLTSSESLGAASLDTDVSDADWTSELATGTEDTAMRFGARELKPNPLAKRLKISNKLLRVAGIDIEALIRKRLSYKIGLPQEKAFLTGTGANQPLGVFTASAQGISTGRDVSTENATTAPTFDGLKNAKFTLKGQYWPRANWIFHRDVVKTIAKIKDGEGRYLWEDSVKVGEPDRLLGLPVRMSEFAPNTLTTGLYVGILGDFAFYWIADALDMVIQRLVELYAESNQVGFIARLETDGMPVLEEAFVRVKLA